MADSLCNDFKAVDNNITPLHYLQNNFTKPGNKMKWKYVTTYELEQIIKSLNSKNSHGYDGISNKIIKLRVLFIISPLTYLQCDSKSRDFSR